MDKENFIVAVVSESWHLQANADAQIETRVT
jgi:hypothetical protein